jgi:hypothetical protein
VSWPPLLAWLTFAARTTMLGDAKTSLRPAQRRLQRCLPVSYKAEAGSNCDEAGDSVSWPSSVAWLTSAARATMPGDAKISLRPAQRLLERSVIVSEIAVAGLNCDEAGH